MAKVTWKKKRKIQVFLNPDERFLLSEVVVSAPGAPKWNLHEAESGRFIGTFYTKRAAAKAIRRRREADLAAAPLDKPIPKKAAT